MMKTNKSTIVKIVVPILILLVIIAIWIGKNMTSKPNDNTDPDAMFPLHVTETIDLEELKSYNLPILIDFGADSCAPCKEMAPVLEELNKDLQGKAIILFVDVWKNPELSDGYPISLIPSQVLINSDGTPYTPSSDLEQNMKMYSTKDTNEHVFTTHEGGMNKQTMLEILKEMGMEE